MARFLEAFRMQSAAIGLSLAKCKVAPFAGESFTFVRGLFGSLEWRIGEGPKLLGARLGSD